MTRLTLTLLALICLVVPSGAFAATTNYKPSSVGATLNVTMSADDRANVSGARVREVTDTGFVAETLWGSGKLTWTVRTNEKTPVMRKSGANIALSQITPGDYVSFSGKIQTNMPPFTVDADAVRDWSIGDNYIVYAGTVTAVDTENRTFTLTTSKGGTVTVKTDEDTAYAQNGARTFSDITVGDSVLAFGGGKGSVVSATKVNLTERALADSGNNRKVATGFGPWIDNLLPHFFEGRIF